MAVAVVQTTLDEMKKLSIHIILQRTAIEVVSDKLLGLNLLLGFDDIKKVYFYHEGFLGLLSSSLLLFPQGFGQYVLWPSSGVS